jgi:carboxyl-terminal processing protease
MSKSFQRSIFAVSVLLLLLTVWGGLRSNVRADQKDGAYSEMEVYSEVLNKIQNDYVVDPNMNNVTVGALHGLLESLDADSSYLTPAEYKLYKQHQNEGTAQVGLNVSKRYGYATVVSVVKGSPADKEQIEDGDLIEAIGNQSTRELSLAMIRLLLEGPAGTNVTISVVRPRKPEPDHVTMTRSVVPVPPLSDQLYDNASILYIRPNELTKDRVNEIESRLKGLGKGDGGKAENRETKKVLLDLRDVAVGDEAQGIRLANFFLQSGTIATLSGQKYPSQTFTAEKSKFLTAVPLVVLVNHGTSGPGELVAAAILGNKRGDVVGDRTFGEGSVQKTLELPDGSALILSVAKYAAPDGKKIQDDAVQPNVVVASNDDDDGGAPAAAAPVNKLNPPKVPAVPKAAPDDQLNKALDVLKAKAA